MLFAWNDDTIRWHLEASAYTGFHRNLAALLRPHIPEHAELCDMGCGPALTDYYLLPELRSLTCVDIDAAVLSFVRAHAEEMGYAVSTVQTDGRRAEGMWDTVLAMYHGNISKMGENYLRKARTNLIMVTHGNLIGSTGPAAYREKKPVNTFTTKQWLDEQGWEYTLETHELEFGQPHRSMEDAIAATAVYCPAAPEAELRRYVEEKVVPTGNPEFPLYTPKVRRFGIFAIPRSNLKD